jgi:hypothetical protein
MFCQQTSSTEVRPLTRFRTRLQHQGVEASGQSTNSQPTLPSSHGTICMSFMRQGEVPSLLLPHVAGTLSGTSPPQPGRFQSSSISPSSRRYSSGSTSNPLLGRPQPASNFQDVLVFDRVAAILSLWRVTLSMRRESDVGTLAGIGGLGATLTGGPMSRLTSNDVLHGEEAVVASWDLARKKDWPEVRECLDFPSTISMNGVDKEAKYVSLLGLFLVNNTD